MKTLQQEYEDTLHDAQKFHELGLTESANTLLKHAIELKEQIETLSHS